MNDCQINDQQQELDYLRGASHALAAMAGGTLNTLTAHRWVNFLRGKAAAGKRVPAMMLFLAYAKLGDVTPDDAYAHWLDSQKEVG